MQTEDIQTYLGNKGYTIYKNNISVHEQQYIRDQLTVRPYIPKSPVQPPAFPIYRESQQKLYVPRFFGLDTYGFPDEERLSHGDDINLSFNGSLRDYQENVVSVYLDHTKRSNTPEHKRSGYGGLLEIPCGRGKTVIALNIISKLKKKTLVIVHKNFLVSQWIERIEQFLPNARVGKIQGQVIDIEDKDIVIGMLQSLSMKKYPTEIFESFGLTVVDETHHIAAEVFVRSLFHVVTPYVLGLSATMERKDGLTKVFKQFLGEIIYSEKREQDDNVLVKAINYVSTDPEFLSIKYDYRGNPQYSTMISKLCTCSHRSEFILRVLEDALNVETNKQVMILAHNRNLLTYLHDAIETRKIGGGSVGYYVGGMKEKDLKITESKRVVIATYSMASEALDIKTLTTLILATPKTDVTQSIGRILRVKHAQPLVIDIIDPHDLFVRQWKKRRTYYTKSNYRIIQIDSEEYKTATNESWDVIFEPGMKRVRAKKATKPHAKKKGNGKGKSNTYSVSQTLITTGKIETEMVNPTESDHPLHGACLLDI
ncbi:MAG: hypothetical protein CMH50_03000 [Myxococcales bacterium]|nr:hypothetical protein [Myxococcales bacterium]